MSAGYTISTLYTGNNGDYKDGLADTEYGKDSQYASNAGTGRIGGWRVEMGSKINSPQRLGFCKNDTKGNQLTKFLIYRMVAPDNTIIEIKKQNSTPKNATTITVPTDQQKNFYISVPECIKK